MTIIGTSRVSECSGGSNGTESKNGQHVAPPERGDGEAIPAQQHGADKPREGGTGGKAVEKYGAKIASRIPTES